MGFFGIRKVAEDEVDIAELLTKVRIVSTQPQAWEFGSMEVIRDRFEPVVAATRAFGAVANGGERQIEVIAKHQNVGGGEFVKMEELLYREPNFIIKCLRFDKNMIAGFKPKSVHFGLLPFEMVNFGIKIQGEKAEIVARKIILVAWVAKTDDEFHG